jgi:hypothetical protein
MAATYFLFGDPDWVGVLHYLVLFSLIVAGFVFTVFFICKKVFGGGGASRLTINPDAAEGRKHERR